MEFQTAQDIWAVIGGYALTGSVVAALIQVTKKWLESRPGKVFWALLISLALGAGVYYINLLPGNILVTLAGIYASANSVYLLLFKPNEK